jgi:hypothetical protein
MESILNLVRTVAPSIASAVGGPLAGIAVRTISEVLLGKPDGTEAELEEAAAKATPEQLLALKKAEQEFTVRMRELDIDLERIGNSDRDSARDREVKTKDWMPRALAIVIVGGFMLTVFLVLMGYVEGMKDPLMATTVGTLIGFVSAKCEQVVAYYFGSSAGSKAKDEAMSNMVRK